MHCFPNRQEPGPLELWLLNGHSPIDMEGLFTTNRRIAYEFIRDYGYDLGDQAEREELMGLLSEGLAFLNRLLAMTSQPGESYPTPPSTLVRQDPIDLLLLASDSPGNEALQGWACALLRVVHAISHVNHLLRSPFNAQIREQILGRFRSHLYRAGSQFSLGRRLPLVSVHFREEKSRESLILKLLHKPDNLPQGIYDRVGVRLVTPGRDGVWEVLNYLRENHLVNWAHVIPGRSRNTLRPTHAPGNDENPFRSAEFRCVQFTCQQLIKIRTNGHTPNLRFYFPFEVQILDHENHLKNEQGPSSHVSYRARQVRAVRLRVFGRLLRATDHPRDDTNSVD